ncbi:MAG: HAD family phosphatase [Planctomycetales bacterium]|nr:HAD family phosphatase [Planctomycetales bacterium]
MGNVLAFFSHDRMCAQIGALSGRSAAEIREVLIDTGLQWRFERGWLTEREFQRELERVLEHEFDFDELIRAGSDIFEENVSLLPVLDELHARGIRLVLLSNTCISHFRFVAETYRVLERFDDVVLSCEVGHLKPEPEIFEAAVAAIGCPPDRCFYTDDISEYVATGRRFGLHAEVFEGTDKLLGHLARLGVDVSSDRGCTTSAG